jgi:hypothetical protein
MIEQQENNSRALKKHFELQIKTLQNVPKYAGELQELF